jgi:hypothetical protein
VSGTGFGAAHWCTALFLGSCAAAFLDCLEAVSAAAAAEREGKLGPGLLALQEPPLMVLRLRTVQLLPAPVAVMGPVAALQVGEGRRGRGQGRSV